MKKEFSVENAYFWAACEKYRMITNVDERKKLLQSINDRFLSKTATDPVNVDSSGKNLTLLQLQNADVNLLQNVRNYRYSFVFLYSTSKKIFVKTFLHLIYFSLYY